MPQTVASCVVVQPALSLYHLLGLVMIMTGKWWVVVKTLIKSSLDNYILPGTLTGTEILFVYLYQWKRDISLVAAVSLHHLLNTPGRTELNEAAVVGTKEGGCDTDCRDKACLVPTTPYT